MRRRTTPLRLRRLAGRLLACLLLLLLCGMLVLGALVFTTAGAQVLGRMAQRRDPRLALTIQGGSLWRGLQLGKTSWNDGDRHLSLVSLDLRWRIRPARRPSLHIRLLQIEDLRIGLPVPSEDDDRSPGRRVPELQLPLDLHVSGVRVSPVTVERDGAEHRVDSIQASMAIVGSEWTVHSLSVVHEQGTLEGTGAIRLAGEYPLSSSIRGRSTRLAAPYELVLEVEVRETLLDPRIEMALSANRTPGEAAPVESARALLSGTRQCHELTFSAEGRAGSLNASFRGSLDEEAPRNWSGRLEQGLLAAEGMEWSPTAPLPALRWDAGEAELVVDAHRWVHAGAELRAVEPIRLGRSGAVGIEISGFELAEFHRWLPPVLVLRGTLAAETEIRWTDQTLTHARASVELQDAGIRMAESELLFLDDIPPLDVPIEHFTLSGRLDGPDAVANFEMASPGLGGIRAGVSVPLSPGRRGPEYAGGSGFVRAEGLQLGILQPFLPDLRTLAGEINADILLAGNPRRPSLQGTLSLEHAVLEPAGFPVTIGDLSLNGRFDGQQIFWTGGFRSGEGQATLEGKAAFGEDSWDADIRLTGERLEFAYGTLASLQANPEIKLSLSPGLVELRGTVAIPQALITVQQLPESAVRTSGDVVFVERNAKGSPHGVPETEPRSRHRSIELDLRLGDRVALRGYGITGRLTGHLLFQQTDQDSPSAFGELRIEDGRYRAYGQRLQIRRGRLLFTGPVDRFNLYVEATREAPAYQVVAGLRVEGRPDALESSLFSEPLLPEEEILAFLLLGRPLTRGEDSDASLLIARAALGLGIAGGRGTAASLAERVGIDDLQLDTEGEGDETQVVIRGQVSPRMQVSYASGVFQPANTLTLRYRLIRTLYLEAVSGVENALDLLYTFSF